MPKIFFIDDLFPCIPLGKPLVSESESKDLWLLILEKALKIFSLTAVQ